MEIRTPTLRPAFLRNYIDRLAVESPDLPPTEWFGWILLAFTHATPVMGEPDHGKSSVRSYLVLLRILSVNAAMKQAIALALASAEISQREPKRHLYAPPPSIAISHRVRQYLGGGDVAGISLDDEVASTAAPRVLAERWAAGG